MGPIGRLDLSDDLGDISKPEYFGKEVQNGHQGTYRTCSIIHTLSEKH